MRQWVFRGVPSGFQEAVATHGGQALWTLSFFLAKSPELRGGGGGPSCPRRSSLFGLKRAFSPAAHISGTVGPRGAGLVSLESPEGALSAAGSGAPARRRGRPPQPPLQKQSPHSYAGVAEPGPVLPRRSADRERSSRASRAASPLHGGYGCASGCAEGCRRDFGRQ